MWAYSIRRILWTIPIVLGVVLITFVLFTYVARDPARQYAGKFATPESLAGIRHKMGLDKPRWINTAALAHGEISETFNTQFFDVLLFRFPESMRWEEPLWTLIKRKAPASMTIQIPAFIIELGLQ